MQNPLDFARLLNDTRPMEKARLALRLYEEANVRKRAFDEATNEKARQRSSEVDRLLSMVRTEPNAKAELELAELQKGEREFGNNLVEERRLTDELYQADILAPSRALEWLAEQAADMRAGDGAREPWLRHLHIAPKLVSTDRVLELRSEILSTNEMVADVSRRPATAVELKEQVDAVLDQVSQLGALSLDVRMRDRDPFGLLSALTLNHSISSRSQYTAQILSGGVAVLIALLGDELRLHLHSRIDATDLSGALSGEQRARELTRLASRRLTLERQEEAIICALEERGIVIARRPDLDPRAFLEVEER